MRTLEDYPTNNPSSVALVLDYLTQASSTKHSIDLAQNGIMIEFKKGGWLSSRTYKIYIERLQNSAGRILELDGKKVAGTTLKIGDERELKCIMTADRLLPYLDKIPQATMLMLGIWNNQKPEEDEDLEQYYAGH